VSKLFEVSPHDDDSCAKMSRADDEDNVPFVAVSIFQQSDAAVASQPRPTLPAESHNRARRSAPSPLPARGSPRIQYFDHYRGKIVCFVNHRHVLLSMHNFALPCGLVYAAMFFHAQRSRRPPRLPRYMQLRFPPRQLQRFLRSCVLATAHALVTPPAVVITPLAVSARLDPATMWRWSHRIFVRVMSGFVARAEVRLQGARCACACRDELARLSFARARMVRKLFD
jgi:hypothetical protein